MYATQEKVEAGFTAVGERIDEVEQQIQETNKGIVELAKEFVTVKDGFRSYKIIRRDSQSGNEDRTRFWPNDEHAKAFGEVIIAALRHKTMTETSQNEGGVLVPAELATFIIQKMSDYGVFRRNVTRVPMGSSSLQVPQVTDDMTIYCPGEGGKIDESDVGVGQVTITPKKLACLGRVSSELEEDSAFAIGEIYGQSIARSMAKAEDLCGFLGDGSSTYYGFRGIVGALRAVNATIANIKSLIVGSDNVYSGLTLADFRKVCGILPTGADMGARWYMHKGFFYNVVLPLLWGESAGQPIIGTPTYFEQGPSKFLLGYPVEFTQAMPKAEANSQICALLGDLRLGAFLGERRTLNIARSDQFHFDTDEIAIRGLERIAISIYGEGDTVEAGPICGLITAAS
jgi:HK97 family phage major capsid protein